MPDAVVIGSGPNGLVAAITLAQAGLDVIVHEAADTVGGGVRSAELTLPGFVHDVCSAIYPLAAGSPVLRALELDVEWVQPPAALAHPLDDGTAVTLERDVAETAAQLGADASAYAELVGPLAGAWDAVAPVLLAPAMPPPGRAALSLARALGPAGALRSVRAALADARSLSRLFAGREARALLAGNAAHSMLPLERRPTGAFGLTLLVLGHATGWPLARGGAQRLADALADRLRGLGGEIRLGSRVDELPAAGIVLADVGVPELLRLGRGRLPESYARAAARYRYGPAAFKLDWALAGPIPWRAEECRRAGTVHLGGTLEELADSERAPWEGRVSERPFVLLSQPSLFDPHARTRGQAHRLGVLPRAERLGRRRDRGDRGPGRAFRARVPRPDPGSPRARAARARAAQPQPRGRRHQRRRDDARPGALPARAPAEPVRDGRAGALPLLGLDAAGWRRPRHVRLPRRPGCARGSLLAPAPGRPTRSHNGCMQEPAVDDRIERARDAVASGDWVQAYELLSQLDAEGLAGPDELVSLARSAHWTGRMNECLSAFERAYRLFLDDGRPRNAGMAALDLVRWYRHKLQPAVAAGWLRRAERLLEAEPDTVEFGYLQYRRGGDALAKGDLDAAVELTTEAEELGRRFGDIDLELLAQHERGIALIARGEAEEGFALIDEAAAAALGGELEPLPTAIVYCNTITACRDVADYGRAGEWTEVAKRWCERQAINGFPGMCRVYRAEVMRLRGDWEAAREDAQLACDELRDWSPNTAGAAFYELGEIRLRIGDLDGAEAAFQQAHELGRTTAPGLALLLAARGDASGGAALVARALAEETHGPLARARLLPAQVDLAVATGDVTTAAEAAAELSSTAEAYGSAGLRAAAAAAEGAVALARGDATAAIDSLRTALPNFGVADLPYETASARMLLGRAYRASGDERAASVELESARAVFERLGAALDLQRVGEQLATGSGDAVTRTFVFTDIVDSTPLAGALGDEAWAGLLAWHDRTLTELFGAHGGEVVDHTGDGYFVAFDASERALACAVAIQRRLAEHRKTNGFAPGVRIGVHEAVARRTGDNYRGHGVHEAARIGALGGAGEIVASAATVEGRSVRHSQARPVELKGVDGPVEVVTVDWS